MNKKVAVWGKFDGLHQGHIEFLRHARNLGDELYVILMPDEVVKEKGKLPAEERKQGLLKLEFVKGVFIDSFDRTGLSSILELKPDIFAFGHDQNTKWESKL